MQKLMIHIAFLFLIGLGLSACGGGGGSSSSAAISNAPAEVPVIVTATVSGLTKAGSSLTFVATAADTTNLALSYSWNFGDNQTANGSTTSHAYSSSGTYTAILTVTNSAGLSTTRTLTVTISELPPVIASASVSAGASIGGIVNFAAVASDPANLALSYLWNFGDGLSTDTGASVTRTFNAATTYTVTLTVTNSAGKTDSRTLSVPVSAVLATNVSTDCSALNCSAMSNGNTNTYAGTGTGVWRFDNTTTAAVSRDINIQGLSAGKTVTLIYANASESSNAATLPSAGVLATPVEMFSAPSLSRMEHAQADERHQHRTQHSHMLDANRRLALEMRNEKLTASAALTRPSSIKTDNAVPAIRPVVAGDARVWNENGFTQTDYTTTAQRICPAGTLGRKVVIWAHTTAYPSVITDAQLNAYQATFCGTNNNDGAYAKVANAIGDAWGPVPSKYSATRIADAPGQKQDINIVIVNPTSTVTWGGYFYSFNNRLKSTSSAYATSNEALVFFVKAGQSQNYIQSVLIHELTHMINYYQRTVLNDDTYETWLEETNAMMTQDIFDPGLTITGGCLPIVCDIQFYAQSGAGISYLNWPTSTLSNKHYYMGASFGAFLNRRFGPSIYLQLATDCYSPPANTSGYLCLDMLIKNNGGVSVEAEFARFGASVFGRMGGAGEPANFGFPAKSGSVVLKTTNGAGAISTNFNYNLPAINNWAASVVIPAATQLAAFTYSTHTYRVDTVAAGKTSYVRSGVSVPAKTSLSVVVK